MAGDELQHRADVRPSVAPSVHVHIPPSPLQLPFHPIPWLPSFPPPSRFRTARAQTPSRVSLGPHEGKKERERKWKGRKPHASDERRIPDPRFCLLRRRAFPALEGSWHGNGGSGCPKDVGSGRLRRYSRVCQRSCPPPRAVLCGAHRGVASSVWCELTESVRARATIKECQLWSVEPGISP